MQERILNSETRQFKAIFPSTLNEHDTLFGGTALQWMDEVAYLTAIRFTKQKMVTATADNIQFLLPIKAGTIVEIIGKVIRVRSVKIEIKVEIYFEEMYTNKREMAVEAFFTFAAINEFNSPTRINVEEYLFQTY